MTTSSVTPPAFTEGFLREVTDRFGLNEVFVRRLIHGKPLAKQVIEQWEDLVNPNQRLSSAYIHFALSNVVRGRQARDLIVRKTGIRSGRSLDVGSAYGGMVVAFAEAGFDATGVEIDAHWCDLGNLNCSSRGFGNPIKLQDFLSEPLDKTFDVITCNDVIEHVFEPRRALAKMASMLKPGGVLYLVIPNATSYDHVVRDGHYGQFGMNLLDHHAARAYYDARCKNAFQKEYSCGEFHPLPWYRKQLVAGGLVVGTHRTTPDALPESAKLDQIVRDLDAAFSAWTPVGLTEILGDQIAGRFQQYRTDLIRHFDRARYDPATYRTSFLETYMDSFWTVLATKPT